MTSSTESGSESGPVGLVGVGRMGRCMLEYLRNSGREVVAYDPSPRAWPLIEASGARRAADPVELVRAVRLIVMSLPASRNVAEAVEALAVAARPGQVVVDTSTVDPGTARAAAAVLGGKGAGFVDAPVLGRPNTVGRWTLPAGGAAGDVEFARPTLEIFAKHVIHVGGTGTGYAFKLLNQLMFSVINGISSEVMAIADLMGVDKRTFYDAVVNSGAATVSPLFRDTALRMVDESFEAPTFTLELLCKDAGLALGMAREAGLDPRIAGFVQTLNEAARDGGYGNLDTAALFLPSREYYASRRNA